MAEKVVRLQIRREAGWLYFLRNTEVWRTPMRPTGSPDGNAERIAVGGFTREPGWLYYFDSEGDVSRARRGEPPAASPTERRPDDGAHAAEPRLGGLIDEFPITLITVDEDEDLNTFVVGLSEVPDGSARHVIFERALTFDAQDSRLGMATYCIVLPGQITHYGGVASCILKGDRLELRFDKKAAETFEVSGFSLLLKVDQASIDRLRQGLERIFPPKDRPTEFEI